LLRLVGPLVLGIGLGGLAAWAYFANGHSAAVETASDPPSTGGEAPVKRAVFGLGTIQPREGAVLVTSSQVGTLIQTIPIKEGQWVEQGDVLVELDSSLAEHELRLAKSQRQQASERRQGELLAGRQRLDAARLALEQAQAAQKSEPAAQQKQLDVAKLKADQAHAELNRLEPLARTNPPGVSATQLEHQRGLVRLADAERDAAESAVGRLEQNLAFGVQKAEAEQRAAEQALELVQHGQSLAVLDEQVKLAERKLQECKIVAPVSGTVVSLAAKAGERVSTQPLAQIANLKTLECQAEVDVADVPLLRDRREAFLTSQAFRGARVPATIERIGNIVGAATLRPVDPRKAVDRTVANIVLVVDAAEARRLLGAGEAGSGAALMGLQVDVEIPLPQ
jgi:ABC exporter DevB family membrane fusion protein